MVLHPGIYVSAAAESLKGPALLYFAATLGLIGGVALLLAHNVWAADWRIIITLLGWISVADSTLWLLLADRYASLWSGMLAGHALPYVGGAIVLLCGAILCYFGYAAARRTGE